MGPLGAAVLLRLSLTTLPSLISSKVKKEYFSIVELFLCTLFMYRPVEVKMWTQVCPWMRWTATACRTQFLLKPTFW